MFLVNVSAMLQNLVSTGDLLQGQRLFYGWIISDQHSVP